MKNHDVTISDVAKALGVKPELIKRWGKLFPEYLSPSASWIGKARVYSQTDIQILALICEQHDWEEDDGDYSDIYSALNSGEQFEERYLQIAYFTTPVFQQPPEMLDATWTHGVLIGGMTLRDWLSIAQSFKLCADTLVEQALISESAYLFTYPILYNYRHAIELYLKIATNSDTQTERIHRLRYFVKKLVQQHNAKLSKWSQDYLDQWSQLDEESKTFRYGENWPEGELWVDLKQLKTITGRLCDELEKLIVDQIRAGKSSKA